MTAALAIIAGARDPALYWGAIGTVAALTFMLAAYRVRLEVDGEQIRVFNVTGTYQIPWDSVVGIDVVRWWLSPSVLMVGSAAIRLSTTSGKRIVIDASTMEVPRVLDVLAQFDPEARS